jgi:hypothetical protein
MRTDWTLVLSNVLFFLSAVVFVAGGLVLAVGG